MRLLAAADAPPRYSPTCAVVLYIYTHMTIPYGTMDWSKMDNSVSDILDSALGDAGPHDEKRAPSRSRSNGSSGSRLPPCGGLRNAPAGDLYGIGGAPFCTYDLQYPSPSETGTSMGNIPSSSRSGTASMSISASASTPPPPVPSPMAPGEGIPSDLFSTFQRFKPEIPPPSPTPVSVSVTVSRSSAPSVPVPVAQSSKKRSREDPPMYATAILKRRDVESGEKLMSMNKQRTSEAKKLLLAASKEAKGGGGGNGANEAKRKVRAERNRVSAMKSRERIGKKEEDLERKVFYGRIENKTLKRGIVKFRRYLEGVIGEIENNYPLHHARKLLPSTYRVRDIVEKTIKECVWTFRPEDTPLVELKYKEGEGDEDDGYDEDEA